MIFLAQSAGAVEYTDYISEEGYPRIVLIITIKNLMVRFQ